MRIKGYGIQHLLYYRRHRGYHSRSQVAWIVLTSRSIRLCNRPGRGRADGFGAAGVRSSRMKSVPDATVNWISAREQGRGRGNTPPGKKKLRLSSRSLTRRMMLRGVGDIAGKDKTASSKRKRASLSYRSDNSPGIRRIRRGKGFA